MCGFIAVFSVKSRDFNKKSIEASIGSIRHRGPDSNSTWYDPYGRVAFGYVRLGLVGLSNGIPPIVADQDDLVIMLNGEFYDYINIRSELEKDGCHFKTSSDSEIALHLYRGHGVRGLKHLRSEFSIIIYDRLRNVLLAVRDRIGVKPLYYAEYNGAYYFGSEVKALLAAGVSGEWYQESYANRGFALRDRTVFSRVRSVKPGTLLLADESGLQEKAWWHWSFPSRGTDYYCSLPEDGLIEQVREVIEESVKLRLHADVPLGVALSGRLDSCAMLGIATKLIGRPLRTFHISFNRDGEYDELKYAQLAARHNHAELEVLSVNNDILADHFEATLWHTETPFSNAHSIAKYLLSKFIHEKGLRAVLTGEGADEVFAGYPHYRRDMIRFNSENQNLELIKKLLNRINNDNNRYFRVISKDVNWVNKNLGHGISWIETQSALFSPLKNLFRLEYAQAYKSSAPYRQFFDRLGPPEFESWDPVNKSVYAVAKSSLPNLVLTTLGDRLEMAGSLEGRPPLLDHRVVEIAAELAIWMKIRGEIGKYALREAVRPYVPEQIYKNNKQYFRTPPALLTREAKLFQLIADIIASSQLDSLPFLILLPFGFFFESAILLPDSQRSAANNILMETVGLCLLQKRFRLQ